MKSKQTKTSAQGHPSKMRYVDDNNRLFRQILHISIILMSYVLVDIGDGEVDVCGSNDERSAREAAAWRVHGGRNSTIVGHWWRRPSDDGHVASWECVGGCRLRALL